MDPIIKVFAKQIQTEKQKKMVGHISSSIADAEAGKSKLHEDIYNRKFLDGLSGQKTRHLYNNICSLDNSKYLEIGTYKGSSLCAALYKNIINCTVIEDFSYEGYSQKNELYNNLSKCNINAGDIQIIDSDCFKLDISQLKYNNYTIYLYDAGHDFIEHYKALTYYIDVLDDCFIFIVDDWNWLRVQDGTRKAIQDLNLDIIYSFELIYTNDEHTPALGPDWKFPSENFWNGIAIFILNKPST